MSGTNSRYWADLNLRVASKSEWLLFTVLGCLALHFGCSHQSPMEAPAADPKAMGSVSEHDILAESPPTIEETTMTLKDKPFFDVELDTNSPNECSPKVPAGVRQVIIIAAPERAPFERGKVESPQGPFAVVPICGSMMMSVPSPPTKEPIVFHVVNSKTGQSYKSPLRSLDESPEIPPEDDAPPSPESVRGVYVTGYFNQNLLEHVTLPMGSGTYDVHVRWRGVQSNIVTFELFEAEAASKE